MSIVKLNVKKGDNVVVLSGKDKGKSGLITASVPRKRLVIVEKVNLIKRHTKPSLKAPQGGIIQKEMPIDVSKVMLICPNCNKPTRIAHKIIDGKNTRICKHCGESVEHA